MSAIRPVDPATAGKLLEGPTARLAPMVEVERVFTPDQCARIIALRDRLGFDLAPIPVYTGSSSRGSSSRGSSSRGSSSRGSSSRGSSSNLRQHSVDSSVRKTERTHILPDPQHKWIFDRLGAVVDEVNAATWQFRINFMEPMQLLTYPEGGHFHWHSDLGDRGVAALRKVSATILLSPPDGYEGGDLQFLDAGKELTPGRGHGKGVFFPAWQNHRVTPVTQGVRHVLILWTLGKRSLR